MNKRKETIKSILDDIKAYKNDQTITNYIEEENTVVITVDLIKNSIYKPYSNNSVISDELFDFIDWSFRLIKNKFKIKISLIFPFGMAEEEKNKIKGLFRVHYAMKYEIIKKDVFRTNILGGILLLIGALTMALYWLIYTYNDIFIVSQIIFIFSWVFLWESCDLFCFKNISNRRELNKCIKLYLAEL